MNARMSRHKPACAIGARAPMGPRPERSSVVASAYGETSATSPESKCPWCRDGPGCGPETRGAMAAPTRTGADGDIVDWT